MNNNLIRIFVNQNQLIKISKYSSVYSLKSKIHETIYSYESLDTVMNKFRINFNGKLLLDNKQTLISYGIDDNNNIDVEKNLEGGSWSSLFWLYLIYGICFYFFIILLISGLIPIIANLIGSIFENTLIRIIDYFTKGKNDATTKLMKNIVKFGLYILSFCFTIFFIWAFTSYAVFPFYYFKTNDYCKSGLAAKHVGKVTMFWYMFTYGLFNFIDFVLNQFKDMANKTPIRIIQAVVGPTTTTIKEAWDLVKYIPVYLIPGIGMALFQVHRSIKQVVYYINKGLNYVKYNEISCDDEDYLKKLCVLTSGAEKMIQDYDKKQMKGGDTELSDLKHSIKTVKDVKKSVKKSVDVEIKDSNVTNVLSKGFYSVLYLFIKMNKLENLFKFINVASCDAYNKVKIKKKNPNINDEELMKQIREKREIKISENEEWFASFLFSIFCQLIEAVDDTTDILLGVGDSDTVSNMWCTGIVAGIVTLIPFIIDMFWNTP